jgi:outer membrane protein assembly factor BamB
LNRIAYHFIRSRKPRSSGVIRRIALGLAVCLCVAATAQCKQQLDWLEYRGKDGSGATSNALYPPLGLRWKLRLQFKGDEAASFNPPIIKGETIFFGSSDGNFYALDAESGYMRWIFPTKNAVNSVPFADDDTVYFGSNDGTVYAVNIEDGKEKWNFATGNTVQSLILRYQDNVIFTSDTGATFFLDLNGELQHKIPNPVWSHHTFQVYDGVVYWAPRLRGFGAYDIKRRSFLWNVRVNINYPVWYSFPAIDEENVYYASNFFTGRGSTMQYYALNRVTGAGVWEKQREFDWSRYAEQNADNIFYRHVDLLDYMAPSLWGDLVIYTSGDSTVRAFYKDSGDIAWTRQFDYHTSSAPTIAGDRIYFGILGDERERAGGVIEALPKLVCLSARTGDVLWEMDLEGAVLSAPVISGKRMLFGTDRNMFYVLEEIF